MDTEPRLSHAQALQQTLRPICNWPWVNPLLKHWRIGKSRFGFTPTVKLDVNWYVAAKNVHELNIVPFFDSNLIITCVFFAFYVGI